MNYTKLNRYFRNKMLNPELYIIIYKNKDNGIGSMK